MNTIDIILIIIVLLSAWRGWQKGFVIGVTDLALLIGSVLAAFYFYPYLASFLERYPSLGVWTIPLAFIAILIISRMLLSLVANVLLRNMPPAAHQHTVNRFFGIFPGLVNGLINAVIAAPTGPYSGMRIRFSPMLIKTEIMNSMFCFRNSKTAVR